MALNVIRSYEKVSNDNGFVSIKPKDSKALSFLKSKFKDELNEDKDDILDKYIFDIEIDNVKLKGSNVSIPMDGRVEYTVTDKKKRNIKKEKDISIVLSTRVDDLSIGVDSEKAFNK